MATQLLNDDGTASMATMMMSSHFAFRRDLACFASSLTADRVNAEALSAEWTTYRGSLHGHHSVEDANVFPDLRARHPELAGAIDELDAHHRAIDPLLERGDRVFADLAANLGEARDLIGELQRLLAEHLDAEEAVVIPHLRAAKEFPVPPSDDVLAMYADGFAWSCAGIAPSVFSQICAILPPALVAKLPAARDAFDARCLRVWGRVHVDESVTSAPARGYAPRSQRDHRKQGGS
ncbi:MAG TPA: hemerythrin domain-containing protein [Kofleriaceae bacterium]